MATEKYLMNLEHNPSLSQVVETPPPEISNFYWKNDYGRKYKVFIPTPNRSLYYNLEEYEGDININEFDDNRWTFAKKCVLLAVSKTSIADQPFINHMDFLIANLFEWDIRNDELLSNIGGDIEDHDVNLKKHYILNKYLVNDITNVSMAIRGNLAKFRGTIAIHPDIDHAKVIYAMKMGFELAAERFVNDRNHKVYAYGHNNHKFSYY